MATGGRIRHILAANVNSILDRVEDPAKMLRSLLREMDEARHESEATLKSLQHELAEMDSEIERCEKSVAHLDQQAERFLSENNENAAREALAQKQKKVEQVRSTRKAHADVQVAATELRENLHRLTEKRTQAIAYLQDTTKSQAHRAQENRYRTRADAQLSRTDETLERLECRIDRMTAQAEALGLGTPAPTVQTGLGHGETKNAAVDEELELLKKRIA